MRVKDLEERRSSLPLPLGSGVTRFFLLVSHQPVSGIEPLCVALVPVWQQAFVLVGRTSALVTEYGVSNPVGEKCTVQSALVRVI